MKRDPAMIRSTCRAGQLTAETPLALIPAIAWLRDAKNSVQAMAIALRVPEDLWPALAYHASRRHFVPPVAIKTLIELIGREKLQRAIGHKFARPLMKRFA